MHVDESDFDFNFDLDDDTMKVIEAQENAFLTQPPPPLQQAQPQLGYTLGPVEFSSNKSVSKVAETQPVENLEIKALKDEIERMRREKWTKEGEVVLLREKLSKVESDKYDIVQKHQQKLLALETEKDAMIEHWKREIDRLSSELQFRENEMRMRPSTRVDTESRTSSTVASSHFASAFGDLLNANPSKKPKPGRKEASCEVELLASEVSTSLFLRVPQEDTSAGINRSELIDNFYKAIGNAESLLNERKWKYRESDITRFEKDRECLFRILHLTRDPIMSMDLLFHMINAEEPSIRVVFLILILELNTFLCRNLCIALCSDTYTYSPLPEYKKNKLKEINKNIRTDKTSCTLLADLVSFYCKNIRIGKASNVQYQFLCIFRHVLYRCPTPQKLPSCVLQLLAEGAILKNLYSFNNTDHASTMYILTASLVGVMTGDSRVAPLLTQQICFNHQNNDDVECSLLNHLNEILAKGLLELDYAEEIPYGHKRAMISLFSLVRKRQLPACVVFEPETLRVISRKLAQKAWNERDVPLPYADIATLIHLAYQVVVVEKAPIVKLLSREFLNMAFAINKLAEDKEVVALASAHLEPLRMRLLEHFKDIEDGKYAPKINGVYIERRATPLTEEEEITMLNEIIAQKEANQKTDTES